MREVFSFLHDLLGTSRHTNKSTLGTKDRSLAATSVRSIAQHAD